MIKTLIIWHIVIYNVVQAASVTCVFVSVCVCVCGECIQTSVAFVRRSVCALCKCRALWQPGRQQQSGERAATCPTLPHSTLGPLPARCYGLSCQSPGGPRPSSRQVGRRGESRHLRFYSGGPLLFLWQWRIVKPLSSSWTLLAVF